MLNDAENIPEDTIQSVLNSSRLLAAQNLEMLSPDEKEALLAWLQQNPEHKNWLLTLSEPGKISQLLAEFERAENMAGPALEEFHQKHLIESDAADIPSKPVVHQSHFLKTSWFRYAAAIVLFFGTAAWFYIASRTPDKQFAEHSLPVENDIMPGGERAILTLANGQTIVLDSASNGHLADQSGAEIVKLSNGKLIYKISDNAVDEIMLNTMSTPRGGQYQLTLPDGTEVWLNAASSITYPVVFSGSERKVRIAGEVYFDVKKNKEKPFIVDVDGKSTVHVLGTSFNINSYGDEGIIKTTLLEGTINVSSDAISSDDLKSESNPKKSFSAILKPGQQASQSLSPSEGNQLKIRDNTDVEQVVSWKNGIFNFEGADFKEAMLQLERWYNIDVSYATTIPDIQFKGKMNRGVKLSTILSWFSELGIKSRIEGRRLIIL